MPNSKQQQRHEQEQLLLLGQRLHSIGKGCNPPSLSLPNRSGDTNKNEIHFGAQQAGGQRGGARHSGAPMLCRYATTSAWLRRMA